MTNLKVTGTQTIGSIQFTGIEGGFGEDKKAMLVKDIAEIHGTEVRTINQTIFRNMKRFVQEVDLIDLKQITESDVFLKFGFTKAQWGNSNAVFILSERGYAKLLKILEDDKAWEIYDQLVDNYFSMRKEQEFKIPKSTRDLTLLALQANEETNERLDDVESRITSFEENKLITSEDVGTIGRHVRNKVYQFANDRHLGKEAVSMLYRDLNSSVKQVFNVPNRGRIKDKDFQSVLEFIYSWEPSSVTKAKISQISLF
ncbi:ORF6C domain-containing protein [Enterococcus sp. MMGLQ5-1]|uniref:ORF6N domain-containing protein n=1 Tax=Enterococcus sp. MMGLQ5-1 TaxID=2737663 RepID=UPI00155378B1|nr:ORF6C domain-containing protein [Enterococcus sp. MMGLQ5-1]MBS7584181.1 ORF6C domain-containing protein [Enterococcus sp. MMGLQ5-1]NPD12039.1 hypothetical protein [Enterococcus sp. MMGLQ5-1]